MKVDDVVGAAFLPTDGQANPSDITMALARARAWPARRSARTPRCSSIEVVDGVITAVVTDARPDRVRASSCAAPASGRATLAATVGVNVPLVSVRASVRHHRPVRCGVPRDLPTLRDPDRLTYYKEEVGGLVMGGYEPNPIPWADDGIPRDFHFKLLDADFDHFAPIMELAMGRVPGAADGGHQPADQRPGELHARRQLHPRRGAGAEELLRRRRLQRLRHRRRRRRRHGAGRMGRTRASPPYDLWVVDIRRFGRPHLDTDWVRTRTLEAYGKHYTMAWPYEEHDSGRPCRTFAAVLATARRRARASARSSAGSGRTGSPIAVARRDRRTTSTATTARTGSMPSAASTAPCREAAVLFDQTSFAKFALKGPDALAALNWICANDVDKPVGSLTYTQMLDDSRRHRMRPHRLPRRRRRVLHRHRHRLRDARLRLDPAQHPGGLERAAGRRHVGLRRCCR